MAGRKALPKELKVVKGTFRKHREISGTPQAVDGDMEFPAWLPSAAAKHFDLLKFRIGELGLASPSYTEALALAALCMHEIEMLTIEIQIDGYVPESMDSRGAERKKALPAFAMRSEARRHLQSLLAEFGLTPAAIQKVGASGGKKENPFGAFG